MITQQRPLGVWGLTIFHAIWAALVIFGMRYYFADELPDGASPVAAKWAPYEIALLVAFISAAWAAWAAIKHGREVFLALLTIIVLLNLQEDYYGVPYLISLANLDPELWVSPSFWWDISEGARYVFWLLFNYWYFFSRHARNFYSQLS